MVPLLLLVAAIGAGARAIAGEEERGTLDLLLSTPVSRRRLALEKLGGARRRGRRARGRALARARVGAQATAMHLSVGDLAAATLMPSSSRSRSARSRCSSAPRPARRGLATGLTRRWRSPPISSTRSRRSSTRSSRPQAFALLPLRRRRSAPARLRARPRAGPRRDRCGRRASGPGLLRPPRPQRLVPRKLRTRSASRALAPMLRRATGRAPH